MQKLQKPIACNIIMMAFQTPENYNCAVPWFSFPTMDTKRWLPKLKLICQRQKEDEGIEE